MNIKNRLLGSASVLALAGGLLVAAAPAAHAAPTAAGSCTGSLSLAKIANATATGGLTDTNQAVTVAAASLKVVNNTGGPATGTPVAGSCALDPSLGGTTVTASKVSSKLSGVASCASATTPGENPAATGQTNGTGGPQYALNGKLTVKEPGLGVPLAGQTQIASYVSVLGFSPLGLDLIDLGGIVTKGDLVGANVTGSLWEDPAVKDTLGDQSSGLVFPGDNGVAKPKTLPTVAGASDTDYSLGLAGLIALGACADGTPNNLAFPGITQVLVGDGPSLLKQFALSPFGIALGAQQPLLAGEASATGVHFSFGE